uniref:WGR domain-containing protein n=1 Tax=viral metagenome TaxID=1070528 RepID=A0A6C0EK14_9ZZZZ
MSSTKLSKDIVKLIGETVYAFIKNVSKEHDLDEEELRVMWEGGKKTKESDKKRSHSAKSDGCPYEYTKGKKQGTLCGVKPKDGAVYCATHKKYEGQQKRERKVIPAPKKTSRKVSEENLVLKMNKDIGKLCHPQSGLVFKSPQEPVAIGKLHQKKIRPLTDEDIETCKKFGFRFAKEEDAKTVVHLVADSATGGKFWEVTKDGEKLITRHGKVGANGKTNSKEYDSPELAEKEMKKLIKEKNKKGYKEKEEDNSSDEDDEEEDEDKDEGKKSDEEGVNESDDDSGDGQEVEMVTKALGVDSDDDDEFLSED